MGNVGVNGYIKFRGRNFVSVLVVTVHQQLCLSRLPDATPFDTMLNMPQASELIEGGI